MTDLTLSDKPAILTDITNPEMDELASYIRLVPDFPEPGILFRDISPILGNPEALRMALTAHVELIDPLPGQDELKLNCDYGIDHIVMIDSRGFLFGILLALELGVGCSMARKAGKLPGAVVEENYGLEYGTDCVQLQTTAFKSGARVLVIDDVLATGGTAAAVVKLIRRLGGEVVGVHVFIELMALNGRNLLDGVEVKSVFQF